VDNLEARIALNNLDDVIDIGAEVMKVPLDVGDLAPQTLRCFPVGKINKLREAGLGELRLVWIVLTKLCGDVPNFAHAQSSTGSGLNS